MLKKLKACFLVFIISISFVKGMDPAPGKKPDVIPADSVSPCFISYFHTAREWNMLYKIGINRSDYEKIMYYESTNEIEDYKIILYDNDQGYFYVSYKYFNMRTSSRAEKLNVLMFFRLLGQGYPGNLIVSTERDYRYFFTIRVIDNQEKARVCFVVPNTEEHSRRVITGLVSLDESEIVHINLNSLSLPAAR